jgi:hypothetical protein
MGNLTGGVLVSPQVCLNLMALPFQVQEVVFIETFRNAIFSKKWHFLFNYLSA